MLHPIWPESAKSHMEPNPLLRRFIAAFNQDRCPLWVDAVEKGKNEPIEIFAFAPVETGFSQSEGSQ